MKISLIQMNIVEKNKNKNVENGLRLLEQSAATSDVIVMPEIWTTGYSLGKLKKEATRIDSELIRSIQIIAKENHTNIIAGSIPIINDKNEVTNSSLTIDRDGEIIFQYDKIHLFGMFNEERFFKQGERLGVYNLDGITCGTAICYDLRFPEYFRYLALKGAKIIFVPAEWPKLRKEVWRLLLQARAVENQIFICAVNCSGSFKGEKFAGSSMIISPNGEILIQAESEEEIASLDINLDEIEKVQSKINVLADSRMHLFNL